MKRVNNDLLFSKGHMYEYMEDPIEILSSLPNGDDPSFPGWEEDKLFKAECTHNGENEDCNSCDGEQLIARVPRSSNNSIVHEGLIASGNAVMRSASLRDRLKQAWGVSCFEMEAAGIMNQFPCIVIRSLCDYSDSHKTKTWQPYAAVAAAAYAKDLLRVIGPEQLSNGVATTNWPMMLHMVVYEGLREEAELLLNSGADINSEDSEGRSVLERSIDGGHVEMTKWLIQRGANIHHTDPIGFTLLYAAAFNGKVELMQILLKHGHDRNFECEDDQGGTPLLRAIDERNLVMAKLLADEGADVFHNDFYDRTMLHGAAINGNFEEVRLLLERGHASNIDHKDCDGYTALHDVSRKGYVDSARLLLQFGADLHIETDSGKSSIIFARENGNTELLKLLDSVHSQ